MTDTNGIPVVTVVGRDLVGNRTKAVAALKAAHNVPQAQGTLYDGALGCYCALGYMGKTLGIDAAMYDALSQAEAYEQIERALGLDSGTVRGMTGRDIWHMNDRERMSLTEIGAELGRRWGVG